MTGLNKIIDRILTDAKEYARKTLETAQRDCRAAAEQYAERAEDIRDEIAERTAAEAEELVEQAKKDAATARDAAIQKTRMAMVAEAFEVAKEALRENDFGKYRELLTALLTSALIEEATAATRAAEQGDAVAEFDCYEVLMNPTDRATYGATVVSAARRAAYRRIGSVRTDKVRLSEETADIDGGLILRYGEVEVDLSLDALLAELREKIEMRVLAILFPEGEDDPLVDA